MPMSGVDGARWGAMGRDSPRVGAEVARSRGPGDGGGPVGGARWAGPGGGPLARMEEGVATAGSPALLLAHSRVIGILWNP